MIGKSNATLPADEQTEAELDQEVLKLFYPNQETQDTIGVSLDIENYCTVSLFFEQTYL